MKVAIISDIHGNAVALEHALFEIKKQNIKQLLIAGDFLGYYYNHKKVFELLADFEIQAVYGNHDKSFSYFLDRNKKEMADYRALYGHSLDIAFDELKGNQKQMIVTLGNQKELMVSNKKILLCHGSPWDDNKYIYPDADKTIFEKIFNLGYDYVILGHTHYPMVKQKGKQFIINPGSIGQPRDEGSNASWAVIDFEKDTVELFRKHFNPQNIIEQVEKIDPQRQHSKDVFNRKKENV